MIADMFTKALPASPVVAIVEVELRLRLSLISECMHVCDSFINSEWATTDNNHTCLLTTKTWLQLNFLKLGSILLVTITVTIDIWIRLPS
jgi:hypothetical protein